MTTGMRLVRLAIAGCLTSAALLSAQQPDRSAPPDIGPPPALNLPPIAKSALSNGLPVWVIETREVPLAQVNLLIQAGAGDDPAGKFGLASFTAEMLDEGAGSRSALEIADAIDYLGAILATSSSSDASAIRLNVPASKLADALPIMADVALRPAFPEREIDRIRQERLTALLQAEDDPQAIASLAFSRIVFGPANRYGTGQLGTPAAIKEFRAADFRAFHSTYFTPANAALIVVGDVRAAEVVPLLEKHFGSWTGASPARVPVPAARQLTQGQIYLVDKPGAAQSQIRIGWVGVSRSTSDYFTLQVLNTILGGSFSSRLNLNLREKHGYAYGAGSVFDMRLSPGPFFAAAGVQTDKTADALREFFHELRGIAQPVPVAELTRARNYVAFGLPSEFETIADHARHTEELIVYKLPDDYFETYVKHIQQVDATAVQKAAATYIQPAKFAVVVVGDRKTIEAPIRALKLAPIKVMTVAEALGR